MVPATKQLDCDPTEVRHLQRAIGSRHSWAAVSTHEGEELKVAEAHVEVANRLSSQDARRLVTFIVPRHPHRADAIAEAIQSQVRTQRSPEISRS